MSRKKIKYTIAFLVVLFLAYHSVYFKKLDEVKAAAVSDFDAVSYTSEFWTKKLIPALPQAPEIHALLNLLKKDPEKAFRDHSHALGIGNLRYLMVRGTGEITAIHDNTVELRLDSAREKVSILTEYIYGNEVRDASGLIPMNEFDNTMNFNMVSAELNKKIREEILPPFKQQAKTGQRVQFFGAIELNQKYLNINQLELIPVKLNLIPSN